MYTNSPKLIKNYISEFGISHWDEDYIMKTDGDKLCYISPYGRPITKVQTSTYTEFFNKYKKEDYYIFTKNIFGTSPPESDYRFQQTFQTEINIPKEIRESYDFKSTIFFAGNKGRGALPHKHTAALNILATGKKRWFLFDASSSNPMGERLQKYYYSAYPYKTNTTSSDWLDKEYSTSLKNYKDNGGEVYEFIQEAGDVIIIPNEWSHTVINLDDCLGITLIEIPNGVYY